MNVRFLHVFLFALLACLLTACDNAGGQLGEKEQAGKGQAEQVLQTEQNTGGTEQVQDKNFRVIADCYGRKVALPSEINRVVCVGSGALRLLAYLQAEHLLAGVESADLKYAEDPKRDYAYILHAKLKNLPVVGKGGGTAYTAYPEAMLTAKPDLIFSGYTKEAAQQLAKETNIPVVGVRYESKNFVDPSFYASLKLMAEVLGKTERAETLLAAIDACRADLKQRCENVQSETSVYVGAVSYNGSHGFAGTYSKFGPFTAISAQNAADNAEREGFYEVDLEQVLVWNPDIVFLDPSNSQITEQEYKTRPAYFEKLSAVAEGRVYSMPSFNNYSTNITYCLINAYWAGKVIYPNRFADLVLADKANEILTLFLGKAYFEDMQELGLPYGKLDIKHAVQK